MTANGPRTVRLERPPFGATADTIGAMVDDGAAGPLASELVAAAATAVDARDPLRVARRLADVVRDRVAFVRDEYGTETVQSLERTWERRAGDCDDSVVAFLACATAAGLRPGLATVWRETPEGPVAVHVLAVVGHPTTGDPIPVELLEAGSFGAWPDLPPGTWTTVEWLRDAYGPGVGFLDALAGIAGGVLGFLGKSKDAKAAEKVADTNAAATRLAAEAQKAAAAAAERIAAAADASRERNVATAVGFAREAVPMLVRLGMIFAATRVLEAFAARRRAPARRAT